jgi:DNA polymerase alpha-associated DNA helicase A
MEFLLLHEFGRTDTVGRGSKFLKRWMTHLEEHADLRYANLDDITLP